MILSANAPDIDIVSAFFGSDASLGFRRGWTHGPLAVLVLPVLVTGLLMAWDRSIRWRTILALCYLGCLTHPLLDWLNTYGVRLLLPFDDRWFYGDALFIVDPWIWLVLGGALFLGARRDRFPWGWTLLACATSLIVVRAGATVPPAARAIWFAALVALVVLRVATRLRPSALAIVALGLSVAYIGAMLALSTAGSMRVKRELTRGHMEVERLMVGPEPANPFAWDVVADVGDRYVIGSLTWYRQPALTLAPQPIAKTEPSPILEQARAEPSLRGTLAWMRFPYAEIDETSTGWTVHFIDARYVRRRVRGFGTATVEVHP